MISRRTFLKVAGATLAALGTPVATSQKLFGAEPSKVRIRDAVKRLAEADDAPGLLTLMGETFAAHTPDLRLVAGILSYALDCGLGLGPLVRDARKLRSSPGVKEMLAAIRECVVSSRSDDLTRQGAIIAGRWGDGDLRAAYARHVSFSDGPSFDAYSATGEVAACIALADAN